MTWCTWKRGRVTMRAQLALATSGQACVLREVASQWSDEQLLNRVAQWVVPLMDFNAGGWWIVDDTGFPKQGVHSVGVTGKYYGVLGKQGNYQAAVNISLACEQVSLPAALQLHMPRHWAEDAERRLKAGIPEDIEFAARPQMASSYNCAT